MATQERTTLTVEGMSCPSCIRHITEALEDIGGVGTIDVSLEDGTVRVQHDANQAPVGRLIDALRGAGYESQPTRV